MKKIISWILNKSFPIKKDAHASSINKILVMDFGHIGDLVLSLPAIEAIKNIFPNVNIDFVCGEWGRELMINVNGISEVLIFNHPKYDRCGKGLFRSAMSIIGFILRLRKRDYDISIDLQGYLSSAIINLLTMSRYKAGRDRGGYNFPYNYKSSKFIGHEAQNKVDLIRQIDNRASFSGYVLFIPIKSNERIDEIKKSLNIRDYIVIQPSTPWLPRDWDKKKYCDLIRKIIDNTDLQIVIIGDESQKNNNEDFKRVDSLKVINWSGSVSLMEVAALISKAKLFIGSDSGPMHIAVAVGTRVVALMGPGEYPRFAPFNPAIENRVLRHEVCSMQKINNCRQDPKKSFCIMGKNICMQSITVNEVYDTVQELLRY